VRIIRPRVLSFSQGGGGHVSAEGAVCLHLLTSDGWNPQITIEAILIQLRLAISVYGDMGPPARLTAVTKKRQDIGDYPASQAFNGYLRVVQGHGWKPSKGLKDVQNMGNM